MVQRPNGHKLQLKDPFLPTWKPSYAYFTRIGSIIDHLMSAFKLLAKNQKCLFVGSIAASGAGFTFCQTNPPASGSPSINSSEFISPAKINPSASPHSYIVYSKVPGNMQLYSLTREFSYKTKILGQTVKDYTRTLEGGQKFTINLKPDGTLTISTGFVWNGPTGFYPLDSMMRGSCVHDGFYELLSSKAKALDKALDMATAKPIADQLLYDLFVEDGCTKFTAYTAWVTVHTVGRFFMD